MTQAETALLARLLVDPRPIPSLGLTADDFSTPQYRKAWRAMQSLAAEGKVIDLVTLRDEGVDLGDVLDGVTPGHRAPVEAYAEIVKADAFRRSFENTLNELVGRSEAGDDPQELLNALHNEMVALSVDVHPDDTLGRVRLEDYTSAPPDPWLGVLSPFGTTILYGDGGDGKGWVAARLIQGLLQEGKRVAVIDFEMQAQEWGYRLSKFGVALSDVLYFAPAMPLDRWATAQTAQLLKAEGVDFLVIDSAMYATDIDDPYSPAGAVGYGRARKRLNNLPALLLAHVTGNADKVFGSVFWKNECRISWRLRKDKDTRKRFLECRKANGYSWLEGRELNILFSEERGELEFYE